MVTATALERIFGMRSSGLGIHCELREGHKLLGRRTPDLDLVSLPTARCGSSLFYATRCRFLLNLGEPGGLDISPGADRVRLIDAGCVGTWELPALGAVTAPAAVLTSSATERAELKVKILVQRLQIHSGDLGMSGQSLASRR
jgi:3-(3-hydroxy-phenyl)propionate hydroxylase